MLNKEVLQQCGHEYRKCLRRCEMAYDKLRTKPNTPRPSWVGQAAEKLWLSEFLPTHQGVKTGTTDLDAMTGVSNLGDPRRTDAVVMIAGEIAEFELKKSNYTSVRVEQQLACQVFDLGLGTYGAQNLYRICGEDGLIQIWTREDAKRAVEAEVRDGSFTTPKPSVEISFLE